MVIGVHDYFLFDVSGEARLDAILIHGVDEMSTKDIFAYFNDFAPGSVEWIDDSSCKCNMGCLIVLHCQYEKPLLSRQSLVITDMNTVDLDNSNSPLTRTKFPFP